MACKCNCNCKIKLDDITDPVVRKEITEIQKHIDDAICSQLNSVKVSDTYMTDMNYSSEGDIEQRLNLEIEARQLGDEALQNQIDNEVEARQLAIDEAFANVQILVDNEATIRAEEDKKLSDRIDDIESGNLEYIDEKITESIDSVEEDIETIQHWIDIHGGDWEEAVRREQARAMGVEENLQAQIYNKQDTLISGENIKTINNVSILGSGNIDVGGGTGTSDYEQLNNKPSIENITLVGNKTAEDLGLAKSSDLEGKQDIIEDLEEIRSGSEAGSTAVQPSAISDMETKTHAEETYAEKSELDNKQDTLVSGENIKTINNTSLLGEGNISISGSVVTPAGEASIFDDSQPKNLFGKTSVQEEVWESIHVLKSDEQSDFSLDSNNTTTMGVFTQTDQRAIQEKRLDSFRIYVSNTDWNGSIQFYIANIGGTGLLNDTLWPLNSSMNVATYMSKSAPLFKFTPTSEDAGKKCVVKLDGSDTRVSEINQDYVDETGHIYIPMGHYISVKNPNVVENCLWKYSGMTGSFAGFYFINEIPASNPNGGKGIYSTEQLGIGWDIAEVETVTIEKETFDYYFVEDPDAKVEKLVKENFTFSNLGEDYGSFYVFQDCSELNDKYFTSVSYYPIANQTCKFCYLIVPDNSQVSISDANIDVANLVAGNRVLFTITPDSGSSSAERPQKFALDGSDPRVTIVATDLYDAEVGGFLWNSTMTFGFDGRKASGKSMYYSPVEVEGGSQRFVAASPNATTFNQLTNEQLGFGLYAKADSKIRVHSDIIQQALDDIEDLKQGGGSGTTDYEDLDNKPQINNVELSGNKSLSDLGIASTTDLSSKQDTLVSGTNIKTINNASLLGSGNISISGSVITPEGEASVFDNSLPVNLFGETETSVEALVETGIGIGDNSDFTSQRSAPIGPFYYDDQTGIQNQYLYSIRMKFTELGTGKFPVYVANWGGTGTITGTTQAINGITIDWSKWTDDTTYNIPLFTITPNSSDIGQVVEFKLDGTDDRVSDINLDFVRNGYIFIPEGWYLGVGDHGYNNSTGAIGVTGAFAHGGTTNIGSHKFWFTNSTGDNPAAPTATTYANIWLGVQWKVGDIETITTTVPTFDTYFATTETTKEFKEVKENLTNRSLYVDQGGVYPYVNSSVLNDKYLSAISYYPIAGETLKFSYLYVSDNTNVTTSQAASDLANLVAGNRTLFTVTPDSGTSSATIPQMFKLDGSDPRVTIVATDLYDAEVGGFLWNSTMAFTVDARRTSGSSFYYFERDTVPTMSFIYSNDHTLNPSGFTGISQSGLGIGLFVSDTATKYVVHSDIIQQALDDIEDLKQGGGSDVSPLKGKTISFVGDSITTFSGITNVDPLPTNAAVWYPHNSVTNVDQTYWKKLIDRTGVELLVNNAWSGSHVTNRTRGDICNYDYQADSGSGTSTVKDRCTHLHRTEGGLIRNPDYIVINMGTNDFDNMNSTYTMGTWNGRGEKFPDITAKPTNFREAYAVMLRRITTTYPLAKVFCCTVPCGNVRGDGLNEVNAVGVYLVEFNDAIREIATAFGCRVIELATSGLNYNTLSTLYEDGNLHPNEAGMERYYEIIRQALEDGDTTNVSCPRNTAVMKGTPTTVSNATSTDDVVAQFNTLLSVLRDRGVIAS